MLGKLIKYDLKNAARIFLLVHGIYLFICIILRLLVMNPLDFSAPSRLLITPLTLIVVLFIFLLTAMTLTTSLLIALRFYRNLFSKEGYLSWTLPAAPSTHLLAKFLSGYLIAAADIIIIAAGILVLVTGSNVADAYRQIAPDMEKVLGITLGSYALKLFLFTVIFTFTSIVQIYFCIALGIYSHFYFYFYCTDLFLHSSGTAFSGTPGTACYCLLFSGRFWRTDPYHFAAAYNRTYQATDVC